MKNYGLGLLCGAVLLCSAGLHAADTKTYQVTGPVLEVTPSTIVVQKGNDKWEIARSGSTKVTGDLKPGVKVTIHYTMAATEIQVKTTKNSKETKTKTTKSGQ